MAQFIELLSPGGLSVFIRCASIERILAPGSMPPDKIASPQEPLHIIVREGREVLSAYGCSVLDILHGIHRDDCFLDSRSGDSPSP